MRRLWMFVAVFVGLLPSLGGCDSPTGTTGLDPKSGEDKANTAPGKVESPGEESDAGHESRGDRRKIKPNPVCNEWEKPAVAFAVTGQMHGYMEPCGCADPQYGGISRRADLLKQLRDKGWNVVPVDLGGALKRTREQSKLKFQTLRSALIDMKYEAFALGVEELRMEPAWLLSHRDPDDPAAGPAFLCANITLFHSPELGVPVPSKILDAGGKKVGLTAVFGTQLIKEIGTVNGDEIQIVEPAAPLRKILAGFEQKSVDIRVLMSHATLSESRDLAKQFPQFDLILCTGPTEDPVSNYHENIGETALVMCGHKGKYTAIVGWYPDAEEPLRTELVKLDGDRFADPPKMIGHMKYYQSLLKDLKLAETEPAVKHSSGDSFVGAEQCGNCHEKAFAKWKSTGHARGFASIRKGRRGIPRIHDPECLACHVTGWHPQEVFRYESGYLSEVASKNLLGNQCENCHGPGSRHIRLIEAGEEDEAKKLMRVTRAQARDTLCYTCHDLDNSPHFEFESYWKKIAHPWRD